MDQLQQQIESLSIKSKVTGLIYNEKTLLHKDPSNKHVERPERVSAIVSKIRQYISNQPAQDAFQVIDDFEPWYWFWFSGSTQESIQLAHPEKYFDKIESIYEEVDGQPSNKKAIWFGSDTYVNTHTANAARLAVQGTLIALEKVLSNSWANAFAAVRPPGHHSGHVTSPNGFCIYNNVAIGLNHIRKKFNVKKVCIFDWDVHHGDGTEHLTYSDPSTLFISMHRYDERLFYPSSGHPERVGGKGAEGFNINVGWNVQQYGAKSGITAGAAEYLYAYTRLLEPIIREFAPEVIIISAGFDSAEGDPLGRCAMTPDGYAYITERLQRIQPKIVVVLEGGYNLDSISNAARSVFRVLAGEKLPHEKGAPAADDWILKLRPNIIGIKAVEATLKHHVNFWPVLSAPEQLNYDRRFLGEESKFITGGHLESFKIKGDKVYKKAKQNELLFYTSLDDSSSPFYGENQYLIKNGLIPKYFGLEDKFIIMENLFQGMPNASIIDIKLGVKTYDPNGSPDKTLRELEKSLRSTNNSLGLRLAGVKYKNSMNEITTDIHGEKAYTEINTYAKLKACIFQVLKSNDMVIQNEDALWFAVDFVRLLIDFIKTKSKRFYRSSSLLIGVDNIEEKFVVKWIDFNYVFPLSKDTEAQDQSHDQNILVGLETVLRILLELKGTQN